MKNLTLTTVLLLSLSSLFAQKQDHDPNLIFGKYIYTDKATGKNGALMIPLSPANGP